MELFGATELGNTDCPFKFINQNKLTMKMNMEKIITKVIVFCRVSSREQEETGYSLDAQEKLLTEYAAKNGFAVAKVFKISESASGKQIRKMFNEMLQYATAHKIPVILCEKIDRLTRNIKDAAIINDWITESEARQVHFVKENFILSRNTRAHENLVWDMKVAIARFYTNNLSEEVKKGQKEKLAQGWMPMRAKLGYKSVGEKGRKTHALDEAVAPFIAQMFELYSTGNYSIKSLAEKMTKAGMRNEFGKKMNKSRMHEMLSDPFYCGDIVWMGQTYDGKHEPIISRELFAVVQKKLSGKFKNPQQQKHLPVFKAKIECEECGGTIAWGIAKGHWYGYCNHHKQCSQKGTTRQEEVERQIIPSMNAVAPRTTRALEWLEGVLKESHAGEIAFNTARRDDLAQVIRTADQRIEGAYRDKLDGKMPGDLCAKIITESTDQKRDALKALETLTDARQAYYEAGYAIHELAMHAEAIYHSPKAVTEDQRLLLSYAFSNLSLNASKIKPE
jgi:DNA invertase Pin-like site-specific DNA recombinase